MRNFKSVIGLVSLAVILGTVVFMPERPSAQSDIRGFQPWSSSAVLSSGVVAFTLQAAPTGTGRGLVVLNVVCTVLISAAFAMEVDSSNGAPDFIRIPASAAVGTQYFYRSTHGMYVGTNDTLRMISATAGPSMFCAADGYVRGSAQ